MPREFPWYEAVDCKEPVQQGDFLLSCPIYIPSSSSAIAEAEAIPVEIVEYDVIVMSQSCDLLQKKVDLVLVCPIWALNELEQRNEFIKSNRGKEALRQGNMPGYHLLNKSEIDGLAREFTVVDFRSTYSVPFAIVGGVSRKQTKRLRLSPPYREHLSQAYARFFMRVGLPIDIPKFR